MTHQPISIEIVSNAAELIVLLEDRVMTIALRFALLTALAAGALAADDPLRTIDFGEG